jgi:S1-C subfamily serine protease
MTALSLENLSEQLAGVVAGIAPSLVAVHGRRHFPSSGFVWRPGLIVTAEDTIEADEDLAVTTADGRKLSATLVGRDPSTDVALLRIEDQSIAAAPLRPAAGLRAGHLAIAVGRRREGASASLGVVSLAGEAWQSLRGGRIDRLIHLDHRISPREEGGLALDADGKAVGMTVFGPRRRVIVIPSETIERAAQHLLDHGRVARGYLGLGLQPVRVDRAVAERLSLTEPTGLMVISVDPKGPADDAGLRQGDVLVSWNGEALRSVRAAHARLGPDSVGQSATVGIVRAGETQTVALTVRERPQRS